MTRKALLLTTVAALGVDAFVATTVLPEDTGDAVMTLVLVFALVVCGAWMAWDAWR